MILIDSSLWLEYFQASPLAKKHENYFKKPEKILVSTINLFEIYRKIAKHSEDLALSAVAYMKHGKVVAPDESIVLGAGDLAIKYQLAMADSIILATAYHYNAELITKDNDFKNLPGCIIIH